MNAYQISEWEAFDRLEPIGSWVENYRLAYLCSVVSNIAISIHGPRGSKKYTKPLDFMIEWDPMEKEKPVQSPEEIKAWWTAFAETHNKQFKRTANINKIPPKRIVPNKYLGL